MPRPLITAKLLLLLGLAQTVGAVEPTVGEVWAQQTAPGQPWIAGCGEDAPIFPDHPPIAEIPSAMPYPPDDWSSIQGAGPGAPVVFNALTGEERVLELSQRQGELPDREPGYDGPWGYSDGEGPTKSFNPMTQVLNTQDHPWRMNAKMVMRFLTTTGYDAFFVCSGSMIDAETVLTAGHCVYSHDPDIEGWAQEIWVYPGWNGNGTYGDRPVEPYGFGHGTSYGSWTGWTQNGNWDNDVGLVRLNRGVGMLTGWYGWAWGQDCAWLQGQTSNNASFPAESCPDPGLHNGRDMYFWYGTIDACPNNQLQLNTGGGHCFDTVWGGMSGGGMYFIDGSTRYVHAVCSTSNRYDLAFYCRQWEDWIIWMTGTFIPGSRGPDFDLQALQARTTPTTVTAGQPLATSTFFATNPTNGSANTSHTFDVYLSSDDNISSADTLLSTQGFSWSFAPMSSVTVNMVAPMIPIGTPSGDYFYGVELRPGTDVDDSNNSSDFWDAQALTVDGVVDIVADWISAPQGIHPQGSYFMVDHQFRNQGGDLCELIDVEIRASTDTTITSADILLRDYAYLNIPGQFLLVDTNPVTPPVGMPSGWYHVGIIMSSDDDVNSTNNIACDPQRIMIFDGMFYDGFESASTSAWSVVSP